MTWVSMSDRLGSPVRASVWAEATSCRWILALLTTACTTRAVTAIVRTAIDTARTTRSEVSTGSLEARTMTGTVSAEVVTIKRLSSGRCWRSIDFFVSVRIEGCRNAAAANRRDAMYALSA